MSRNTYPWYWAYLSTRANHVKRCFSQPLYSRRAGWGKGLRGTLDKPAGSQRKTGLKISSRLSLFIQLPNQLLKFYPSDWHICKNYSISQVHGRPWLRKNRMWTAFEMKSQTNNTLFLLGSSISCLWPPVSGDPGPAQGRGFKSPETEWASYLVI